MKTRLKASSIPTDIKLNVFKFNIDELIKSHKDYSKVIKDSEGKLVCHICGKSFRSLSAHIWQSHNLTVKQYKILFGISQRTALISDDIREIKKGYITGEVKNKLLSDGYNTRYK
ncbi:MAG: MucR family transcriptional regulator [Novosphingobium sp.]|nr:MucR family transcriptional regulator [Novosphingobium sp.]